MKIEIGFKFYSRKFVGEVIEEHRNDMVGINFDSRDGRERNYNVVSRNLIRNMVEQKEWFIGEDPWKS